MLEFFPNIKDVNVIVTIIFGHASLLLCPEVQEELILQSKCDFDSKTNLYILLNVLFCTFNLIVSLYCQCNFEFACDG